MKIAYEEREIQKMNTILDLDKIRNAEINTDYFPYCQVDCVIKKERINDILHEFPEINIRGSIPSHRLTYGNTFQKLIDELHHNNLRELVADKFSIDLSQSHPMLTIRGRTEMKDGRIHTDTPSKLMTLLLYLNEDWFEQTGNLRLLKNNESLDNYFEEITPTFGKLLLFKVTDNCWHGHHPFSGKRHTLQFNYVTSQKIVYKEMKKHSFSYTMKKLVSLVKSD
jgi:SM-20-related protein